MQETLGPDELLGSIVAGRYSIEQRLGHGAMGAVYRARHVRLGRPFAIKILHDHLSDEKVLKRFEREAEIAGKLHHPNLVSVVDVGAIQDRPYLVMELAPGTSLAGLITGPWPASRVIPLVRQLCDGLHYAHELGLIHRDFKPENVLVERHADNRETPRIVDFGIAILRDATAERFTTAGLVMGTPQYMAPEQACAADMDHRVDLFALGVICYELLTGRAPFDGTGVDIARANLLTPTPAMAARAPTVQVDPLLEAFTRKLLAKAKTDRPVSAAAARQLLDLIERDRPAAAKALKVPLPNTTAMAPPVAKSGPIPRPVAAAPSSRGDIGTDHTVEAPPARRPVARRQRRAMLAGIATLAFAAAIAVGVWAARRSSDETPAKSALSATDTMRSPTAKTSSPVAATGARSSSDTSGTSPATGTTTSSPVGASQTGGTTTSLSNAGSSQTGGTTTSLSNAGSSQTSGTTTTSSTRTASSTGTPTTSTSRASTTSPSSSPTTSPTLTLSSTHSTTSSTSPSTTSATSPSNAMTSKATSPGIKPLPSTAPTTSPRTNATTSPPPAAPPGKAPSGKTTTEPTATAVANLYVAVGGELKAFSDANGQAAAADLWSRYRRIPLNDVLATPARRQATTELLVLIRRDLSARQPP